VKKDTFLSCYFCFGDFPLSDVKEWIDKSEALCPNCDMNSVIPSAELSDECTLDIMKSYWFDGGIQLVVEEGVIKDVLNVNEVYHEEDFAQERKALIGLKIEEISS